MIRPYPYGDRVLVSAHRGYVRGGFENTMTGFRLGIACGADMLETDVRRSRDGALILMHDADCGRTTDGHGAVKDLAMEEIRRLNAVVHADPSALPPSLLKKAGVFSAAGEPLPPEPPPLLAELLDLAEEHPHILLNIELKDYTFEQGEEWALAAARETAELILKRGLAERTWINSFEGRLLAYVYHRYGSAFRYHGFYPWFILGEMDTDPETFIDVACMQHHYQAADGTVQKYEDPLCPREWFDHLRARGIMPLLAPSLLELPKYDLGIAWGSRIVTPDDPAAMIAHLRDRGLRD